MTSNRLLRLLVGTLGLSLAGKLFGFLRMQQIAAQLGASLHADALLLAFQLLLFLDTVFIAGAMTPSLLARFYQIEKSDGSGAADRLALHAFRVGMTVSLVFGAAIAGFPAQMAAFLAPGFSSEAQQLFSELLRFGVLTPLLLATLHFCSLINRVMDNGVWYSINQIVTNSGALAGLLTGIYLIGTPSAGALGTIVGFGCAALGGTILQWLVAPMGAKQRLLGNQSTLAREESRAFWWSSSALLGALVLQEGFLYVDLALASLTQTGGIALLGYSNRLAMLSNALIVAPAFVIIEPRWARARAYETDTKSVAMIQSDATAILSLLAPVSVVMIVNSEELGHLVFASDEWPTADAAALTTLIKVFGFGVLAFGSTLLAARALNIFNLANAIFKSNAFALIVKIGLAYVLMKYFGLVGIAVSTAVTALLLTALYETQLRKSRQHGLFSGRTVRGLSFVLALTIPAAHLPRLFFENDFLTLALSAVIATVTTVAIGVNLRLSYAATVMSFLTRKPNDNLR